MSALELLTKVGIAAIHGYDLALANARRGRLGRPPGDSAIVAVRDSTRNAEKGPWRKGV